MPNELLFRANGISRLRNYANDVDMKKMEDG
jgi:hypothetical protein